MKKKKIVIMLTTLFVIGLFASCQKETNENWSEVINLYVDAELGEYRPWGHPECVAPFDGLKIKESKDADWVIIPMDGIIGFHYVEGYEYLLEVEKTHIANPPADATNIKYTLIRIISSK